MKVPASIFRAYDIRGVYPDELNPETVYLIGLGLGSYLQGKDIKECAVGSDNRPSSPDVVKELTRGLVATGINVIQIGITLTPLIHFITHIPGFGAAVNVTASHNPKKYNGIKIDLLKSHSVAGEELQDLYKLIEHERFLKTEKKGVVEEKDILPFYTEYIKKQFNFSSKLKIVVDCGNGATSTIAPKVLDAVGCKIVPVDCTINPDFPHGIPDPANSVYMEDLKNKVREHSADIGFSFDTDGDRLGVVDEKGNIIENDRLLMLFSERVLRDNPGAVIAYDVKSTALLDRLIKELGGKPLMTQTGRAHLLDALKDGALLGSEYSGHTYWNHRFLGFDDGIYTLLRLVEILVNEKKPLSELMSKYPKMESTAEIKVPVSEEVKFKLVADVREKILGSTEFSDVITIDGVRASMSETGWFLVRASNTSAYLSIRAEGRDKEEVEKLLEKLYSLLDM